MDLRKLDPLPIFFAVNASHVKLYGASRFKENLKWLEDEERQKARKVSTQALEDAERRFLSWREALESVTKCMGLTYKPEPFYSLKGVLVSFAICLGLPINSCGQRAQDVLVDKIVESVKEMLYKTRG
ncbi:PREDICTED: uncharacterized protein LOC104718904 isoform X2 [Camelina sativa]|uniref:Uncharacterized protein LOC104718904 isoform X2 n=1 Tax=Camelina sativa TaxID=90675 RepID=A0ABM0U2Z1_CAMSA|nr:PREDICTED: uncharacterized protein LOC104718904 isoform X2 [Camelina sativa]